MARPHPHPQMSLPISIDIHGKLCHAACRTGFEKEGWEIAAIAIYDWLARNAPDVMPLPSTQGYQWKQLFLPNGTVLRTVFGGKNFHCIVEGDKILYNGAAVSPSSFANAIGGVRRNAWRVIWVLFPGTTEWKLAGTLRKRPRPRH